MALNWASVVGGGSECRVAAALRLAASFSLSRVCTSSGESPPTIGLICSPAAGAAPGFGLAAFVELEENQSPTAPTKTTARKTHDCICFGITPVAATRLLLTGAAAADSSGASGAGVDGAAVLDMVTPPASQMLSCACQSRDSLCQQCGR